MAASSSSVFASPRCVAAEQDAVIGDDADRIAPDMGETANQGLAVQLLEFIELGAVDHPRDDVMHVERLAPVGGHHAINLFGRKQRLARLTHVQSHAGGRLQVATMRRAMPIAWLSFWA